ncbi:MAG: tyrosine-type recombinase/integrase, partial [Clostridiales bacterium]|nr:tyrosine-type recombinase/integrase [Clostridiales bacterium]
MSLRKWQKNYLRYNKNKASEDCSWIEHIYPGNPRFMCEMRFTHDLRHSTASILFDRGMQLEDVKNWLRHADIETTSNIYLHYGRGRKKLVSDT